MANSAIIVREYDNSDHDAVVSLWSAVFPNEPPWNEPDEFIRRKRISKPRLFWVAQDGGKVIGTVVAGYDGVRGWVYHLAVDPAKRREGVGRRLMQVAEHSLRKLGCPKINLQVRAKNPAAVRFYAALGYVTEDRTSMGKPVRRRGYR